MKLSRDEFYARLDAGTLRLTFIGMSNIGKSFTAMRLRKSHGFALYEVDEAIQKSLGLKSMQESADWMGFPYEETYAKREAEYLELESNLTAQAFDNDKENLILDTTGSVIYLNKETRDMLAKQSVIVHIQAGPNNLARLEKLYFKSPKPLIWNGVYEDGCDRTQALKDAYPKLLASRMDAYNAMADVNVKASLLFEGTTTPETILDAIAAG